jgi:hypothetical protein
VQGDAVRLTHRPDPGSAQATRVVGAFPGLRAARWGRSSDGNRSDDRDPPIGWESMVRARRPVRQSLHRSGPQTPTGSRPGHPDLTRDRTAVLIGTIPGGSLAVDTHDHLFLDSRHSRARRSRTLDGRSPRSWRRRPAASARSSR